MTTLAELGIAVRADGPVEQRVSCPRCAQGQRDDALGVNIETGVFHCFRCGWSGHAAVGGTRAPQNVLRLCDPTLAERKRQRLRRVWSETVALTDSRARAVREYLASRSLAEILCDPPHALRAHPGLQYYDSARVAGTFPAMVALFTDKTGEVVTLHATYVRHDGSAKARVRDPKKLLGVPVRGATRGGAIRLCSPARGVLGIAEGIESALSLRLLHRIPVWAAFCADNLEVVALPRVHTVYVGVDIDANGRGEAAAEKLGKRLRDQPYPPTVYLVLPDGKQVPRDLNDELCHRQRHAS